MKEIFYFFILTSLILQSCSNKERKEIIKTWENGKTAIERIYPNENNFDYTLIQYNEDGSLELKGKFVNKKEQGHFIYYYPNGNKKWVESYDNGISIDTIYCFYESGNLSRKNFPPVDSIREVIEYYETGEIKIKGYIFNSELIDSSWIGYHKDGTIKELGKVDKGSKVGIWKFYNNEGILMDSIDQTGRNKFVFDFEEEEIEYELENSKLSDLK